MKVITKSLRAWNESNIPKCAQDPTAHKLARLLRKCPVCCSRDGFAQHVFALIATMVLREGRGPELANLFESIKKRRWDDLLKHQDWESTSDDLEVYVVRCANGKMALVTVRDPTELFEPERVVDFELLESQAVEQLNDLIQAGQWRAF